MSTRSNVRSSRSDDSRGESRGGGSYGGRSSSRDSNERDGSKSYGKGPMMVRIGSLKFTKKMDQRDQEDLRAFLEEVGAQMWLEIFLPRNTKELTVYPKDKILLSFKKSKNDKIPDYVIGSASLPPEDDR